MATIAIDRFRARYRVPSTVTGAQPRLQQIVATVLDSSLEGAVDRTGVGRDGFVCIRNLHTTVRLALRESDAQLTSQIADALAEAMVETIKHSSSSLVHYPSRGQALIEMTCGALTGDLERQWAWKQLGLWTGDQRPTLAAATRQVMRALIAEPQKAVAVLADLATTRSHVWSILLAVATDVEWIALARAAMAAASTRIREQDDDRHLLSTAGVSTVSFDKTGRAIQARLTAELIASRSVIARVCGTLHGRSVPVQRALTSLVMLEVDPASVAISDGADEILTCVQELLTASPHSVSYGSLSHDSTLAADRVEAPAPDDVQQQGDRRIASPKKTDSEIAVLTSAQRQAATRFAGLLYLIGVSDSIGLPETIVNDARFSGRTSRWILNQLAMLFGVAADDPAALAFAGLRPHEPSPALVEPPAQPSELSTLDEYRSWLIAALRIALDRRDETDEALIRFVVERSGVIVADPGWIEVRFPLDGVSIEIRRAGLDRDPGWVPWLGVVVKVLYV